MEQMTLFDSSLTSQVEQAIAIAAKATPRSPSPIKEPGKVRGPDKATFPEPYGEWANSATYLAARYVLDSGHTQLERLAGVGRLAARKVAAHFEVRVASEAESNEPDYRPGLHERTLLLDYWAEGQILWSQVVTAFERQEKEISGKAALSPEIVAGLEDCQLRGASLVLPRRMRGECMPRLQRILAAIGATRDDAGPLFTLGPSAQARLDIVLQTGTLLPESKVDLASTPKRLATRLMELATLEPGMRVLEPSAGEGSLLQLASQVVGVEDCVAVEARRDDVQALRATGYDASEGDFLSREHWGRHKLLFDRVLMAPPVSNQADIDHVQHAWSMLAGNGRLVALMSAGTATRGNDKACAFRAFVTANGGSLSSPMDGEFMSRGSAARVCILVMDKTKERWSVH